jgi:predicted O-methyltransferase YrrM
VKGKAIIHAARYLLGLERAASQTSSAEQETIARFARGRRRALEIGVFEGATTALIAEQLAPDGNLFGVDPFFTGRLGICWSKIIAQREIARAEVGPKVTLISALSHNAAGQIAEDFFDFVFMDGDHSLQAIAQDWADWSGRVEIGGVMLLHDTQVPRHNPRVRELGSYQYFQQTIAHDPRYELLETIDSLSVLRRR